MDTTKKVPRFVWEAAVILLLAGAAFVWHWWSQREAQARLAALEEGYEAELAAQAESFAESRRALALSEAEAVTRGFAAGVYPAVLAGRPEGLDAAVGEMVQLPEVLFCHVLEPGGGVIATSDRKLAVTGEAGSRAAWALETEDFRTRTGDDGVTELALALRGVSETNVVLWIGYDTRALLRGD